MTSNEYNRAVDEFSDNIYRFALKHLKNEMSAKDIVQETFTKVWIKHEEVAYEKVKSYLFTTAYHAIVDWVKKEGRNGDFEKVEHTASTEFSISFDLQKVLNEALDKLPEVQKTVVLLRDYEGYNYAEIAEITNLNESQVKVYIFRARQTLKEYIKRTELVV
ncbi:MAG: RNA polymerase sigma factor [Crocinitomicaceae bacterium]|nr:MAG: RNA polymerase sigma factor [Crocinitomicaceae bacterium]